MAKSKSKTQGKRGAARAPASRRRTPAWVWAILALIVVGGVAFAVTNLNKPKEPGNTGQPETKQVTIETAKGNIVLEVYLKQMPITGENFIKLVESGFYNVPTMTFHRVEDWVIQGGDPQGTGMGGSSQTIKLEVDPQLKNLRHGGHGPQSEPELSVVAVLHLEEGRQLAGWAIRDLRQGGPGHGCGR